MKYYEKEVIMAQKYEITKLVEIYNKHLDGSECYDTDD